MSTTRHNLETRIEALFGRRQFAIKLGLDTERALCEALSNPQDRMAVIHVAGTNGKGSTCAVIESILRAHGLRTGLYTSPHLCRLNERFRINGVCIDDDALIAGLDRLDHAAARAGLTDDDTPTFFEATTALAFTTFHATGVQVAVIETGLGGRLDATNVVRPLLSVITPIACDHTEHLGDTLTAIAGEKCGIIKEGRPIVSAPQSDEAATVISTTARRCGSRLILAADDLHLRTHQTTLDSQKISFESCSGLGGTAQVSLAGAHQRTNIATGIVAAATAADVIGLPLDAACISSGLDTLRWPGRLSRIQDDPLIVLDAAHNPSGAEALTHALARDAQGPVGMIVGMCRDKDIASTMRILARSAQRLWTVPVSNARGADPAEIAATVQHPVSTACRTLEDALRDGTAWAKRMGGMLCICGSIFLVGEAYRAFGQDPYALDSDT